ncbi:small cell adhesion glycoprotein [Canis lupus baileyi]
MQTPVSVTFPTCRKFKLRRRGRADGSGPRIPAHPGRRPLGAREEEPRPGGRRQPCGPGQRRRPAARDLQRAAAPRLPVPPSPPPRRPAAPSASASAARRRVRARLPRPGPGAPRPPPARPARRTRGEERPGPFRGRRATHGPPLRGGARRFAAMTSLLSTAPPGEDPMTTPMLQATEALSPEAEASTALIAVVITVVFLTLLSVVILIFFYLYKNKGSYVTYEPAEGEPSAILQMESDSAKGRDKEEYFI